MIFIMASVNIQMLARGYLSWELTHSPIMVTIAGAGFAPPILLFSIFGGAVVDRVERKKVLQNGQFGMFIIAMTIAISIKTETITIYHLIGSSLFQGTIWAFLMPARQAIVTQIVSKRQVNNAIALNASGMSLTTLAAQAFGGIIYGFYGPEIAYYFISLFALISIIFTSFIPKLPLLSHVKENVIYEMKNGINYVLRNNAVMWLLVIALTTTLLAWPFRNLLPVQIDEVFSRGPEALGLLMSMIGLGSLFGSLFIAGIKSGESKGIILLLTSFITSIAIILNAISTEYWIAVLLMVLLGIGDSGRRTLNTSLLMERTEEKFRGRVMGIYMMNFGLMPLGAIPLGFIAENYNVRIAFLIPGILLLVFTLLIATLTKSVRNLK